MIEDLTADEYGNLVASVGTHKGRRHLLPYQCSDLIDRTLKGSSIEQVSNAIDISSSQITKFLNLKKLPPEIRKMVCFGKQKGCITFSTATEITRLDSDPEKLMLCRAALEYNLSKLEVISIIQRRDRSHLDLSNVIQEILKLRPVIERQYLYLIGIEKLNFENELGLKKIIRKQLAKKIGASNILSVSIADKRLAILLSESGAKASSVSSNLSSGNMRAFLQSIVSQRSLA